MNVTLNETDLGPLFTPARAVLAVFLSAFPIATVFGNCLIIFSVINRSYLQTPTGFLIVSLAFADLIVGIIVMPLNIVFECLGRVWVLGLELCDIWHAIDVLASTASIWNLAVISLDRYIAVKDPLSYREIMLPQRVYTAIAAVWLWSTAISIPAIYWWRTVSPELYVDESQCRFTDDLTYVVLGSLLCFYVPLFLTLFAYRNVFKIASKREQSLVSGKVRLGGGSGKKRSKKKTKTSAESGTDIEPDSGSVYMRIHRGGCPPNAPKPEKLSTETGLPTPRCSAPASPMPIRSKKSIRFKDVHDDNEDIILVTTNGHNAPDDPQCSAIEGKDDSSDIVDEEDLDEVTPSLKNRRLKRLARIGSSHILQPVTGAQIRLRGLFFDAVKTVGERAKENRARKAFAKFLKEKRAAKTLGIVVGCFVLCWLPYFVVNILVTVCPTCLQDPQSWFVVVTWLGHINSALNPPIYTLFNREFRRAVKSVLFRPKRYSTRKGLSKAIEHSLSVMVVQVSRSKEKEEEKDQFGPEYFL